MAPEHNLLKRTRTSSDFWGGIAMIAIALFAFYASRDLTGMSGISFGPGTAPRLFAGLLLALGVIIVAMGIFADGPRFPKLAFRGPALVTASILFFALAIRPLGLVISSFVMFVFAASGSKDTRWIETIIAGALLTGFCTALFVYLLELPFQLWPRFVPGPPRVGY